MGSLFTQYWRPIRMVILRCLLFLLPSFFCVFALDPKADCKWDIHNCGHSETLCVPEESVYLDAKGQKSSKHDHCLAIQDEDKGEFENYEISVEMLSLESTEGINSGNVGIMFNFLDEMNYDFVYLEIHVNSTGYLVSGYRVNGEKFVDGYVRIPGEMLGTMYHTLKLVVNNDSPNSTEVFLDEKLFGTIQEHFVSRLKGGVFVLNKFEGVAFSRNM